MEATLGEQTAVGFSAGTEGPEQRQELEASDEAVTFMSGIEPAELQKCVFADSLVTVSEGGRELGEFSVTVEFARREQPCMMLHAQSHGAIDDCPCGTAVTAYLMTDLDVLEEDHHEYVKLEGHSVDKRCHMVQCDGQMVIHKVTTVGEEVTEESMSYPMSVLRGLVTEGSSLLLMRLIALRRKMPENMTFVSLDPGLHIINTSFRELGQRQLEVGGELLDVFGVERIIQSMEGSPSTWQCYFLDDGHLVTRVQVGSPVTMRLLELPSKAEKDFKKIPLVWEEDMQMRSKFLDRKEELKADHSSYLRQHPEIRALISDFLQLLLLRKPDDVFLFAREYFTPFASNHPADADQEAQSL
ncbi:ciliogenesis-associated TTC17-interacting protein-like isoform X2 [Astatotilapia calliptera]|uniref:ciliogenesis-associated TTC17-interacting protein-like isoform X2 n=1 Tax=Astatotilapia calliptera TaxID=8154 RepID=UPI000E413756|nr:ciliogenesis-associated TTC17-interacting protein-like isoform X2 [Astatotilapia calliptera]